MATEATITVPSETFPLGTIFETLPGVRVEIERIVPDVDVVIPYFWVRGVATDDIEAAFADHPGVKKIRLIDSVEDEYLLRVEWDHDHVGILTILAETGVVLISAVGTNEQWTFDIRGDTSDDMAEFLQRCRESDLPVTLTELHALTPVETTGGGESHGRATGDGGTGLRTGVLRRPAEDNSKRTCRPAEHFGQCALSATAPWVDRDVGGDATG